MFSDVLTILLKYSSGLYALGEAGWDLKVSAKAVCEAFVNFEDHQSCKVLLLLSARSCLGLA